MNETRSVSARESAETRSAGARAPEVRRARKARALELPPHASVRALAHAAIAEGRAHFLHNARRLLPAHDPELVHQTRVALRRLRVFVRLFRARIGRQRAARLGEALRWLFEPLGELRDLQLFVREFAPGARKGGTRGFELRVGRRLAAAQQSLDRALANARFQALCDELASLQQELSTAEPDRRARPWLARRLDARRRRALRRFDAVLRQDVRELHRLRKQLKKLRYSAELARALLPKRVRRAREFLRALRALQDALGAWVDAEVAGALLCELGAPRALRARLNERIAQRSADQLASLQAHFARFADAPAFWR